MTPLLLHSVYVPGLLPDSQETCEKNLRRNRHTCLVEPGGMNEDESADLRYT